MSLSHVGKVECPNCSNIQQFTFWDSINVTADPELKGQLTSGELRKCVCQKCGLEMHATNNCLYHDMENHFAIQLDYGDQKPSAQDLKMREVFPRLTKAKCRTVKSFAELIDKINIFDRDFSDYEIELFKLQICQRDKIDFAVPMYFGRVETNDSGGTDLVLISEFNGKLFKKGYPFPQCLEGIETMISILTKFFDDRETWPRVDRHYIWNAIQKADFS
jgi:hypothetical protein